MKIRYLSDLHLEFIRPHKMHKFLRNIQPNMKEICILAGDIGNPLHSNDNYDIFMKFVNENFQRTFVITGNHEYYNKTKNIREIDDYLVEYFKQYENISFLNNTYECYEDTCFIGSTLWSKITNPLYEINDVYSIKDLDYIKYNRMNRQCIDFLDETISAHNNCIVITHHGPSRSFIDPKYTIPRMLPYNQWFYCDMDEFIKKYKNNIKCWFYGHTHTPSTHIMHDIPFLCNPIGYPNENPKNDYNKIFTLSPI